MVKIAHIADTHIRNLKYHDDYRQVFAQLYSKLKEQEPDYIVHCGDIAHTKTQLSPEFFELAREFLTGLADVAPTYVILGNHDGNLKNSNRQDAISPIVDAMGHPNLHLLKDSGETDIGNNIVLNVLSVFDRENWVNPTDKEKINIALYHGAISGCKTASGWTMTHGEDSLGIFNEFDFAMLGDIHKPQALDMKGRIRYAGSTIQQNFGEEPRKGYLLWTINGRWDWKADMVYLRHPTPFLSIPIQEDGSFPEHLHIPKGARLRLVCNYNLPIDKLRKACDIAKIKWKPTAVTFLQKGSSNTSLNENFLGPKIENLRDISIQERYIRKYLEDYELEDEVMDKVLQLNKKYNAEAEKNEEVSRNVVWKIKEMEWNNLFNYGEKNKVNFEKLNGLVGIFGKNYSGKSSIIDAALFGVFNTTSKGERKNVHIINQNKDSADIKISLEAGGQTYKICRNLNRYTKKLKGKETTEAKTDLDFHDETADESRNGTTRNETDSNIRRVFGTIDDFMITSMASQMDSLSFIKEGSTKRKEILAKFLDLELFDKKFKYAKKDAAELSALIKRLRQKDISTSVNNKQEELVEIIEEIDSQREICDEIARRYNNLTKEHNEISQSINSMPAEIIDIDGVNASIISKENELKELVATSLTIRSAMVNNEDIMKEIEQFQADFNVSRLKGLEAEYQQWSDQARTHKGNIEKTKIRLNACENKIKMLENHEYDPNCQYCRNNEFVKEANEALNRIDKIKEEIQSHTDLMIQAETKATEIGIDTVRDHLAKYDKLEARRADLSNKIDRDHLTVESISSKTELVQNELDSLKKKQQKYNENKHIIENLETLLREQKGVETKLEQYQEKINNCNDKVQQSLIQQGSTQQMIERLKEEQGEHDKLEKEWMIYELFMKCMHPNGIAYEIIKEKLPIVNEEISKILANIVDFEVFFENNDKKLDIYIKHPQYDPRPLSMGSGAEKTIAAMAIRLGLISITNLPKSELFILDEPATALDQEHMEGFIRLLDMIKSQFKTVLLISHLEALKDTVDTTIDIERDGSFAKVFMK